MGVTGNVLLSDILRFFCLFFWVFLHYPLQISCIVLINYLVENFI